ncbi:hypothetical protein EVJ58_g4897 [Rhodofomes roseus]|nr:hypothetical protein EVJ58_g4897 [Rhodofomes roseus]
MRLYIMYRCNRALLITLCAIFVVELTVETTIIAEVIYNLKDITLSIDIPVSGCVAVGIKQWAWAYWVPVMIWEALLLVLSLYRSAQQAREEAGTPHLMVVLLRDSVLYFGGALASILANFIVWKVQATALFFAFIPLIMALNSVLGCRMMLHITRAGRKHVQATAKESYLLTSDISIDDADDGSKAGDDDVSESDHHASLPSLARTPRVPSVAPVRNSTSTAGRSAVSSPSPSSWLGLSTTGACEDVIEITSTASEHLNWDIYARRNDLI